MKTQKEAVRFIHFFRLPAGNWKVCWKNSQGRLVFRDTYTTFEAAFHNAKAARVALTICAPNIRWEVVDSEIE